MGAVRDLQVKTCKCVKITKPKRKTKPKRAQQIYPRLFKPSQSLLANQFLFSANTKFQYNSDFNKEFAFTFCSTCNNKFQRLKYKDKLTKKLPKTPTKKMDKESDSTFEIDNSSSPEFFDDEYKDIEEIKLYIIVDKRGKKSSSKALVIKPVEYTNVMEKINAVVQKALQNENIKPADYSISYKAMNSRGLSSELEDELDFNEFIEDYKKVIAANKKMAVMIELEDSTNEKVKKTEKRSKVSDESELSTSEEGNVS
uniref:Uncharacterized protein n=1 Tax=Rhizophagus irregularis (strain DAOM 181602 / DAOM 197198 / MUCL 43194) TaxID=747089 RepID=U9U3P5_RHIID